MYARRKPPRERHNPPGGEPLPRVGQVVVGAGAGASGEDEISLLDIWRVLRRYSALVLGLMVAVGLASTAAALLMTPVYRAEVLVAPVTDLNDNQPNGVSMSDFGSLAILAGIKLNHKDKRGESIATLRSRQFTEQFIETAHLRPVLFADKWDEKRRDWQEHLDAQDIPTLWDAYEKFSQSVRHIREDRSNGLVALSVEWVNPQQAAQWANGLIDSVNAVLRQQAVETSNNAIAYLRDQLSRTTVVDLQQVLHRLIEAEMKKIILANINSEYAFKVIDKAVVPQEPIRPKTALMIVLGALAGLFVGILAAVAVNGLRNARDAARVTVATPTGKSSSR